MTAGQIALNIAIVIGSVLALWFGADFFVASAARIARKMGMSELVIGLTIVAMGTSAPEFAVTALAAWHGTASIPVGNVVGSNIFNLGFILGTVAIIHTIRTDKAVIFPGRQHPDWLNAAVAALHVGWSTGSLGGHRHVPLPARLPRLSHVPARI